MAKLSQVDKALRVLRFFLGLRNDRIAATLMAHGFGNDDLAEGWSLLRRVTRESLDHVPPLPPAAPSPADDLDRLDAWENKWFPIAQAALKRHAPAANRALFAGLGRNQGAMVILSVGGFLTRFDGLTRMKKEGGLAATGAAARKLLEQRGLTAPVIAEARALIDRLQNGTPSSEPVPDLAHLAAEAEARAAAETALWAWYLEWSVIARKTLKDRSLLRQLGFLQKTGASSPDDDDDPATPEPPLAAPATASNAPAMASTAPATAPAAPSRGPAAPNKGARSAKKGARGAMKPRKGRGG